MGVLGKVNIGGVLRNLTGEGYVNIGGVLRPITIGNFNIGGVLLAGGYTWKKYKCTETVTYKMKTDKNASDLAFYTTRSITLYKTYTYNSSDGTFTVPAASSQKISASGSGIGDVRYNYPYYKNSDTEISRITSDYTYKYNQYYYSRTRYYSEKVTSYSQGTYIEDVIAASETAFPENGRHTDGYWYVKQ